MENFATTSLECEIDGVMTIFKFSHPVISMTRQVAIRRLLDMGCELVPDIVDLPAWLISTPPQVQASFLKLKPELFVYYKLRIPESATISRADWKTLASLIELRHLSISSNNLLPEDLLHIEALEQLEVLVLHSGVVDDSFCYAIPKLKQIRFIDVMGTSVTQAGLHRLKNVYPEAKIYSDRELET